MSLRINIFFTKFIVFYVYPAISFLLTIRFEEVQEQKKLEMVYRLGWEVFGKELEYFQDHETRNKRYSDKFDEYSISFLCFFWKKPIGTLRLILDSPMGFYIERDYSFIQPSIPRQQIAEVSRLIVLKKYRGRLRLPSLGLIRSAINYSFSHGITHWYMVVGDDVRESFERLGVKLTPLDLGELSSEQLEEREHLKDYYKKVKNPLPYILSLDGVIKML